MFNEDNVYNKNRILRAALYLRCSTEEQALRGYSIAAQKATLEEYCHKNKIKIVDYYSDEGVSGGIAYTKRPEMMRLLSDVEKGKIDIALFVKLDRWFRNIGEYYKVQEILERNRVAWKSLIEDYDTSTANGRMAVNIFLSVAQNERERTAERISAVFEYKRKNKEVTFPTTSTPFGYKVVVDEQGKRRLIKDEEVEEAVNMFFNICIKYQNINYAAKEVSLEYGINRLYNHWNRMINSDIYAGIYHNTKNYCEPYISYEELLKLRDRDNRVRTHSRNRIYLFTGLLRCSECNRKMSGTYTNRIRKNGERTEYKRYRCAYSAAAHMCGCTDTISERKAEKWLLENISSLVDGEIAKVEIEKQKPRKKKPKNNIQSLKERLRRLDVIYMAGNIGDDEYLSQQQEIKNAIAKAESEQKESDDPHDRDITNLQKLLETDLKSIYKELDDIDKRRFWHSIIKQMNIKNNQISHVEFK